MYDAKRAGRDRLDTAEVSASRGHRHRSPPVTPYPPAPSRVPKFDEALGERDPEFIADFDASGHRARRVIMAGVLVIVLAVLAAAGHVLPMPADSLSVSRWFLAAGLAPLALIALLASTVPRFRHRSGAIQVACVIGIVITQTTLRVLPRPDVDEIITVLMPISVILSLGVVEIRFRWMLPAMVVLFGFVTIDVDRLKEYNGTYGHPAGDACLQRIATVLEAAADGQSTQVYRLGGEEFAAVISTPSVADAEPVAEALVTAVTDANIPSATPEQPVTVSAGFTDIRPSDDHTTLLARADAALYQAKRAGRNRLVVDMSA